MTAHLCNSPPHAVGLRWTADAGGSLTGWPGHWPSRLARQVQQDTIWALFWPSCAPQTQEKLRFKECHTKSVNGKLEFQPTFLMLLFACFSAWLLKNSTRVKLFSYAITNKSNLCHIKLISNLKLSDISFLLHLISKWRRKDFWDRQAFLTGWEDTAVHTGERYSERSCMLCWSQGTGCR